MDKNFGTPQNLEHRMSSRGNHFADELFLVQESHINGQDQENDGQSSGLVSHLLQDRRTDTAADAESESDVEWMVNEDLRNLHTKLVGGPPRQKRSSREINTGGGRCYVMGVAVRYRTAGYVVLNYRTCETLKVGVVDVSTFADIHEKAREVLGVLTAAKHSTEAAQLDHQPPSANGEDDVNIRWVVALDDGLRVRATPGAIHRSKDVAKVSGLVESGCLTLFSCNRIDVLSIVEAKRLAEVVTKKPAKTVQQLLDLVRTEVPNFPIMKSVKSTAMYDEAQFAMLDAWIVSKLKARNERKLQIKANEAFMAEVEHRIQLDRRIQTIQQTLTGTLDKSTIADLQQALQSRAAQLRDAHLNKHVSALVFKRD